MDALMDVTEAADPTEGPPEWQLSPNYNTWLNYKQLAPATFLFYAEEAPEQKAKRAAVNPQAPENSGVWWERTEDADTLCPIYSRVLAPETMGRYARQLLHLQQEALLRRRINLPTLHVAKAVDRLLAQPDSHNLMCRVTQGRELGVLIAISPFLHLLALLHRANGSRPNMLMSCVRGGLGAKVDANEVSKAALKSIKHAYKTLRSDGQTIGGIFSGTRHDLSPYTLVAVFMEWSVFKAVLADIRAYIGPGLATMRVEDCPMTPDGAWLDFVERVRTGAPTGVLVAEMETPAEPDVPEVVVDEVPPVNPEVEHTAAVPSGRDRRTKPKVMPSALLAGMDGDDLWEEVMTHPNGCFTCEVEGPVRISAEVKHLTGGERAPTDSTTTRCKRTVRLDDSVVRSRLAVMPWADFVATVDARRHPARRELERRLGRQLGFHKADVVDITPDRMGDLPGLVAGLHRPQADRLCVVRLVLRHRVVLPSLSERKALIARERDNSPLVIKTREVDGRLHRQKFRFAKSLVPMLAVFPAAWLAETREWYMAGLFGTPYDPALCDFCGDMPQEWREELKSVMPVLHEGRRDIDVRALLDAHG